MNGIGKFVILAIGGIFTLGALSTNHSAPSQEQATQAKSEQKAPPPTPAPGQEVSEEFFDYLHRKALWDCSQAIKGMVKYDIRSPDVVYGTNTGDWAFLRFTRWSKYVANDGSITIRGDDAELQNGFGNWIRHTYSCTVNVNSMKVLDAGLSAGKLPRL